jgi:hypothetical protein
VSEHDPLAGKPSECPACVEEGRSAEEFFAFRFDRREDPEETCDCEPQFPEPDEDEDEDVDVPFEELVDRTVAVIDLLRVLQGMGYTSSATCIQNLRRALDDLTFLIATDVRDIEP